MSERSDPGRALVDWTDAELAAVLLSQLWRWLDAGGKSDGRSYDAAILEAARDLLRLPIPPGGEPENRPRDLDLLDEVQRRRLARPARTCDDLDARSAPPAVESAVVAATGTAAHPTVVEMARAAVWFEMARCEIADGPRLGDMLERARDTDREFQARVRAIPLDVRDALLGVGVGG